MDINYLENYNDMCIHARYWYYVKAQPLYTDATYDVLERNVRWYLTEHPEWNRPDLEIYKVGSSNPADYPEWCKVRKPKWPKHKS